MATSRFSMRGHSASWTTMATSNICWAVFISLCLLQLCHCQPPGVPPRQNHPPQPLEGQEHQKVEYDVFDTDSLPGVQFEFKVDVAAGVQECFFQRLLHRAQLHLIFEVLKGSDRKVNLAVLRPDGSTFLVHQWTSEGNSDVEVDMEGDYAFCIDNTFSRFSHKLVNLFIATYRKQDWEEFAHELEEFDVSVKNVTSSLDTVNEAVVSMRKMIALGGNSYIRDWYLIQSNNKYVQNLSITMCILIAITSGVQAYFVRRLFYTPNVTPTSKPRA